MQSSGNAFPADERQQRQRVDANKKANKKLTGFFSKI
jgi:hypothetical protein